jgi:hypothetical protein
MPDKTWKQGQAASHVMTCLDSVPKAVPDGLVVVRNAVRPTRRLASRGFRAWLQQPSDELTVCSCGWASELPEHYRVGLAATT